MADAWAHLMAVIGWREALLAAIALLVLYLVLVVIRLLRLRPADNTSGHEATHHIDAVVGDDDEAPAQLPPLATGEPMPSGTASTTTTPPALRYVEHRHLDPIEHELTDLRADVHALRRELQQLRADVQGQVERLRAAQATSPLYSDAMQLAQLGYDANAIADRCGVAIAEAELVVALAHSQRSQGMQ